MNTIKLKARAKINLSIDIKGLMENGYHDVEMIMQSISLSDYIVMRKIEKGFRLTCSSEDVPTDDRNIIYKTWKLMKEKYNIKNGLSVFLEKNIPIAAGMAGGSADSAAVFIGINKLFNLGISEDELIELSKQLGSDIAFCLKGGSYIATGTGTDLKKIKGLNPKKYKILVCKPDFFISTKRIYKKFDKMFLDENNKIKETLIRPDNKKILEALNTENEDLLLDSMENVLENVTKTICKEIDIIEKKMMNNGAKYSMMSGSGPTVFGIFDDIKKAKKCSNYLRKKYSQTYVSDVVFKGVEICGYK